MFSIEPPVMSANDQALPHRRSEAEAVREGRIRTPTPFPTAGSAKLSAVVSPPRRPWTADADLFFRSVSTEVKQDVLSIMLSNLFIQSLMNNHNLNFIHHLYKNLSDEFISVHFLFHRIILT